MTPRDAHVQAALVLIASLYVWFAVSLVGGHGTAIAWGPTIAERHGFPAANTSSGMLRVTTLPAPTRIRAGCRTVGLPTAACATASPGT